MTGLKLKQDNVKFRTTSLCEGSSRPFALLRMTNKESFILTYVEVQQHTY